MAACAWSVAAASNPASPNSAARRAARMPGAAPPGCPHDRGHRERGRERRQPRPCDSWKLRLRALRSARTASGVGRRDVRRGSRKIAGAKL
jgi:hypothetical protein